MGSLQLYRNKKTGRRVFVTKREDTVVTIKYQDSNKSYKYDEHEFIEKFEKLT